MTLDEAIKHAEEVAEEYGKEVQALEAQLQTEYKKIKSCKKYEEEHRQIAEWLKELKQLREQTRWIPVSEPPKYGKEVLTYSNGGFIEIQSYEMDYGHWGEHWENQHGDWSGDDEVIAWMPLPKPYVPDTNIGKMEIPTDSGLQERSGEE